MAQITLDISPAHVARIQAALTELLNLTDQDGNPRQATVVEVKQWVKDQIVDMVTLSERRVMVAQARQNGPAAIDIT